MLLRHTGTTQTVFIGVEAETRGLQNSWHLCKFGHSVNDTCANRHRCAKYTSWFFESLPFTPPPPLNGVHSALLRLCWITYFPNLCSDKWNLINGTGVDLHACRPECKQLSKMIIKFYSVSILPLCGFFITNRNSA